MADDFKKAQAKGIGAGGYRCNCCHCKYDSGRKKMLSKIKKKLSRLARRTLKQELTNWEESYEEYHED